MKALNMVYLSFFAFVLGNICTFSFIYVFAFHSDMKIYGIFNGFFMGDLNLFIIFTVAFSLFVNFDKSALEVNDRLKEGEEIKFC
jgi:hypothetical protein